MKILEINGKIEKIKNCMQCDHVGVNHDYIWSCYYDENDIKKIGFSLAEFEEWFGLEIPSWCKLEDVEE